MKNEKLYIFTLFNRICLIETFAPYSFIPRIWKFIYKKIYFLNKNISIFKPESNPTEASERLVIILKVHFIIITCVERNYKS